MCCHHALPCPQATRRLSPPRGVQGAHLRQGPPAQPPPMAWALLPPPLQLGPPHSPMRSPPLPPECSFEEWLSTEVAIPSVGSYMPPPACTSPCIHGPSGQTSSTSCTGYGPVSPARWTMNHLNHDHLHCRATCHDVHRRHPCCLIHHQDACRSRATSTSPPTPPLLGRTCCCGSPLAVGPPSPALSP
jgi:hypothetical protein